MIADDIPETYGLSMSSGNLFDVIKHAKPFIVPTSLRVDPFLEKKCAGAIQVSRNLARTLFAIQENGYQQLQAEALLASRHYTIEALRQRNAGLFNQ